MIPSRDISRLLEIMAALRTPGSGCPWDLAQNFATIAPYTLEEAYEVADAIARNDLADLREELGDLLLQVVFHARMAQEQAAFDFGDVVQAITEKLVRRHPHVFGDVKVSGSDEVVTNWEAIKAEEKAGRGVLDGVPKALPALLRALRVGEKAARVGFDWPDLTGARSKVDEELAELDAALVSGDAAHAGRELGDVLFALVSVARKANLDPEAALRGTLERFTQRVRGAEALAATRGLSLSGLAPETLEQLWQDVKARE
jgi:ATP diphosphatase